MNKVKCVYYAYPSSILATEYKMAKTGCWYVFTGDENGADCRHDIVSCHLTKDDAIIAAEMHNLPWGNYSMYKGESK